MSTLLAPVLALGLLLCAAEGAWGFVNSTELVAEMAELRTMPKGHRIARWAELFAGTPYDPDPLGLYVTTRRVVADEAVDCMYHVFRSVELGLSNSPEGAIERALEMRFITGGRLGPDGLVDNYIERYEYAEDMLLGHPSVSGDIVSKWGQNVTEELGVPTSEVEGSRHHKGPLRIIPKASAPAAAGALRTGDIIYFVKDPAKRSVGEIVGHLGVIKREAEGLYLIHASGSKNKGGVVRKLPFLDYMRETGFIGFLAGRFK